MTARFNITCSIISNDLCTFANLSHKRGLVAVSCGSSAIKVLACSLFLLFLIIPQWANSATKPLIESPRFLHLDTSDGLSQNTVNDLHLDAYGFLWVANEEGLNRFDGHKVIQVTGKNGEFLNKPVYKIFQDSRKMLWISTGTSGVYRFNPMTKETLSIVAHKYLNDPDWMQYAFVVNEVDNGDILIASNHQVDLYSYATGKTTTLYTLSEKEMAQGHLIRTAYKSGNVLLIGISSGLYSKNLLSAEVKKIEFLPTTSDFVIDENSQNVKQLLEMPNGQLWIGTVKGLHQMSLASLKQHVMADWPAPISTTINAVHNIWELHYHNEENIYIGTDRGIYKTNLSGSLPVLLLTPQQNLEEISDKSVRTIETDNIGNIWLGTNLNGAMFWSPKSTQFRIISNKVNTAPDKKLSDNNVFSIYKENDSTLWVGTSNGLNRVDLQSSKIKQFLASDAAFTRYEQENILEIASVNNQELWLSTGAGLRIFDILTETLKDFSDFAPEQKRLFESYSWGLTPENDEVLWSLSDSGIIRYDTINWTAEKIDLKPLGLTISTITNIIGFDIRTSNLLLSDAGRLIGINTSTLAVTELHSIRNDRASLAMLPTSWLRDANNNFWLSYAGKGLYQLDGNNFTLKNTYSANNLLSTNLIYDLALDNQDNVWFSSHSGIHQFSTRTQELATYGYMQGLSLSEFNEGAFVTLGDDQLVYGSGKGVTIFAPNEVSSFKNKALKTPIITEVFLSSNNIDLPFKNLNDSSIVLAHDDMGLIVYFSSLDYANIKADRFKYRLVSNDKVINFPNSVSNKVEISMLSPGNHVLEIFKIGANTGKPAIARLNIRVNYALFWSPVAFVIYALLILSAFFWFIYRRNRINAVLASANNQITMYNKRLTSALKATNADIWEWSSETKSITTPRMHNDLGYATSETSIDFEKHLHLIHEADRLQYLSVWRKFIRGEEEQFDCTYRMKHANGEYLWFRDAGSISSAEGIATTVTGTYTNVTENIASKEQLKLFGDAFKHTRDWVLIFDRDKQPLGGNPSFYKAFLINERADFKKQLTYIISYQDSIKHKLFSKLSLMQPGEHWKTELELILGDKKIITNTDVNAIEDEKDSRIIEHYLVIMTDITEQKEAESSLLRLASYDVLTGLINRTLLLEKLKQSILYARRHSTSLSVIFIDLDRFKPINDTFGHEAGDKVIVEIAHRIKTKLRDNDIVSRLGGDEFVVVLEEIQDIQSVNKVVTELLLLIELPIYLGSQSVSVSASAGIAIYPNDAVDADSLLRNADVAMYSAKELGKNGYQHFTATMNEKVQQNMLLQNKLKVAVAREEFENYYQPIIDTKTQTTVGFEMLMRWQNESQFISPGVFIPIAEQIGLIVEMTMQAIERGLKDIAGWYEQGFNGYMAINLSAKQFSSRPDFEKIKELLTIYSLPTSCLRFEITEGLLVDNNDNAIDYMHEMRELGFKISLDDFGTGYSSLRYLKDFPIDVLKIDKSFVDDIGVDKGTESIIESTLIMTKMLKMDTVAEGIETSRQVDYFSATNCHYLQGFYFSKPVSNKYCGGLLQKDWSAKLSLSSESRQTVFKT